MLIKTYKLPPPLPAYIPINKKEWGEPGLFLSCAGCSWPWSPIRGPLCPRIDDKHELQTDNIVVITIVFMLLMCVPVELRNSTSPEHNQSTAS